MPLCICKWVNFATLYYLPAGCSIRSIYMRQPWRCLILHLPKCLHGSRAYLGFPLQAVTKTKKIQGPMLLILDGHGFHLSNMVKSTYAEEINMCCLPPRTTHVFQTLDVVIFHPSKAQFNRITQKPKAGNTWWKEPINCWRTNFTKFLKQPWESMTVALVKKDLWKCCLFPLEQNAIDTSKISDNLSNPPLPSSNLLNPNPPKSAEKKNL